jgi:hypothetical protein
VDSSHCLKIEVGDINHILPTESELISADDYLSNITASLKIYFPEDSPCTEIILQSGVIGGDDDLVFFGATEYS